MASKQTPVHTPKVEAPEGFRHLGSVANAGWFDMKTIGNVLRGTLEGMYERKDQQNAEGVSNFFQICISAECQVRMGRGEDTTMTTAKIGDYVNLNYGPKTKVLKADLADISHGAVYEVYGVVAGEKIKLNGGKMMHNIEVFSNMIRAPKAVEDSSPDFSDADDQGPA